MIFPESPKHHSSNAGYTLIEVLVIVIIVGILAAIAAPSWLAYATRQRVRAVETDLVQVLKQAQQEAIAQRSQVTVRIDEAEPLPTVTRVLGPITGTDPVATLVTNADGFSEQLGPNELRANMVTLDASPHLAGTTDEVNFITFDYQGMVRLGPAGTTQALPFVVKINPSTNDNIQACVVVTTILGGTMSFEDATCDNDATAWQNAF